MQMDKLIRDAVHSSVFGQSDLVVDSESESKKKKKRPKTETEEEDLG